MTNKPAAHRPLTFYIRDFDENDQPRLSITEDPDVIVDMLAELPTADWLFVKHNSDSVTSIRVTEWLFHYPKWQEIDCQIKHDEMRDRDLFLGWLRRKRK